VSELILPKEIEKKLNDVAQSTDRETGVKNVFVGMPNMCTLNVGLVSKLFAWAQQRTYTPWFHFLTEKRPIDFARNCLGQRFLDSKCDYMLMIDDDVDPHPALIDLASLDKDIVAGNTHCWINDELMSSIWQRAECEQCMVVEEFKKDGTNKDPSQYQVKGDMLYRWNPFINSYSPFYDRSGSGAQKAKCRCKGTGFDPFVFRTHQQIIGEAGLLRADSVGGASMMIARRVMEKSRWPWFKFLYKESSEIMLTEDHYFCWQALENGFEVWGEPQLVCSHYKILDLWAVQRKIIKSFEQGREYEKSNQQARSGIIIPTADEIASVVK